LQTRWLGRVSYREAWALQEELRERVLAGDDDAQTLLLLEHEPVITLGRSALPSHLLVTEAELSRRGVTLVKTSRGGDVTAHGPGQLVIYPVVRLARGVLAHVEGIGRAIVDELHSRGIEDAEWRRDPAGVWIHDAKIAACGLHIRRRVAIHGFALNVTAESTSLFSLIVPCGIAGARVTSLADHGVTISVRDLADSIGQRIARSW
jgi:lipoate-protein ligase B